MTMGNEIVDKAVEPHKRAESFGRGGSSRGADAGFVVPDQVPDIAIDGFEGALTVNGLLRLNLVRFRLLPGVGKTVREVIATLTMSGSTANSFAVGLLDALNRHGMLAEENPAGAQSEARTAPEVVK
jgi:hypothetical protein